MHCHYMSYSAAGKSESYHIASFMLPPFPKMMRFRSCQRNGESLVHLGKFFRINVIKFFVRSPGDAAIKNHERKNKLYSLLKVVVKSRMKLSSEKMVDVIGLWCKRTI